MRPFLTATVFVAAVDPVAVVLIETTSADAESSGYFKPQRASASAAEMVA